MKRKEKIKKDVKKLKTMKVSFKGEYTGAKTGRLKQVELPLKVKRTKPTMEQLSKKAAETLDSLRRQLERSAQVEYEAAKFKEVSRLAKEASVEGLVIATIEAKEEIKVRP